MQLTTSKLELIKKIVNARLTKTELSKVTAKAKELISNRKPLLAKIQIS